jgi:SAM-dependent methyltransferase
MTGYIMESEREGARLTAKTDLAAVREELELTGLGPGARALDAGCASGAVTREMAARVGAAGRAVGVDFSIERLRLAAERPAANLRYLRATLGALPFPDGSFDYALCRLVLEYVREPAPLVAELVRVVAPGGRLVLADVDGYGLTHYPLTGERQRAIDALSGLLARTGFDPYVGRKLPSLLRQAGVPEVRVHVRPYHVVAGAVPTSTRCNWQYKLETLAPLGRQQLGDAYARHAACFLELLDDPTVFSYSTLILAEGLIPRIRAPGAPPAARVV